MYTHQQESSQANPRPVLAQGFDPRVLGSPLRFYLRGMEKVMDYELTDYFWNQLSYLFFSECLAIHSRDSFWASAICSLVISLLSKVFIPLARFAPLAAAIFAHI